MVSLVATRVATRGNGGNLLVEILIRGIMGMMEGSTRGNGGILLVVMGLFYLW